MSKYTFKRKEVSKPAENESRIMNASATPEENTSVFIKPIKQVSIEEETEENVFSPFDDEPESKRLFGKKKNKKKGDVSADAYIDGEKAEKLSSKIEDIFNEDNMSVDEIKENLSSGKSVDLFSVFSDKKQKPVEVKEESEEELEEDTYEGIEETEIEETEPEQMTIDDEDDDIYVDNGEDVDIPEPPKKVKKVKEEKVIKEYTTPEDKEEFTEEYRKKGQTALFSLIATFISALILLYIESKALPHPAWLMPGTFGIVYLMLDLQFVFISAICIFNSLIDGARSLIAWKPNKNSVTLVAFAVALIQILLHLILDKFSKDISLYSSIFAVCATITALVSYIDVRREHMSFRTAASSKPKNTVATLDESSAEYENFSEYLPEDAALYKIQKTSFVTNFFKTNSRPSPYNDTYKITLPLVLVTSIIFAVLSAVLGKDASVTDAINSFALSFMMALPISSLFIVSLPFFATTLRLSRMNSAIIGEAAIEEYASTSLVSFADTDVFNPKGIKITSIKTYGKSRIDNTYLMAAKVFNIVGGPLKEVFNRSVISVSKPDSSDCILAVTRNGINAQIDSHIVFIGNEDYIEASGFEPIADGIDAAFLSSSGRILYVAIDGEISAKFYVKYVLGKNFKALLDSFYNLGICMAINTRDPNIDTAFVTQILKDENYPIVVVKNTEIPDENDSAPVEKADSGIVSASSVANMLRTFLATDKLSRIISINTLAKYISLIFAFTLIIVAFLVGGSHEKITPMFILLYQIVWSLPIIATSFFG